ncbi:MAG: glycosyltransferase family 4 protein [Candidatus Omnitrophota bacterium]
MKWLIINSYFPPEIGSASFLFFELGKKLASEGHEITVITGFPRYNVDVKSLPPQYRNRLYLREEIAGMNVNRVATMNLPRYIPVARGIDQFIAAFNFLLAGLFLKKGSFERILVYSPPLPLGLAAFALSKIKRIPFIFNVQDLFPQSAIDLGILKNKFLIRMFENIEGFIYRHADVVTVHSDGNRNHVLSKGIRPEKVIIVPNWIDTDAIKPEALDTGFRKEFDLGNSFIISFAGVIGYSQDLDTVIESAVFLKNENILFLIVGEGVEKKRLQQKVESLGLKNVRFLPMLEKEKYVKLLAASDACLVNLHKEVKTPVVPSKLLSIMAAGRAVAASLPLKGDAPKIIQESNCGICVDAGQAQELAEGIKRLHSDEAFRTTCARNGREYAVKHFSLNSCVGIYEKVL